jgi:DNA glycosylase AlkZ-like
LRSLTWGQVLARRLEWHRLVEPAASSQLVDVVADVCGIHAQVMASAELSIALRVRGVTREDVRRELWERRSLVKTWGPRGTLHLLPASEIGFWLAALRHLPDGRTWDPMELTGTSVEQLDSMVRAIADALDGRMLTREALADEVAGRVGPAALDSVFPAFGGTWPRWSLALTEAARSGLICFGPNQGARVRFVRLDQWLGHAGEDGRSTGGPAAPGRTSNPKPTGREAAALLFHRYLAAYGPSTTIEFAQWAATPAENVGELVRSTRDDLVEVDVEGERRWALAADADGEWPPLGRSVRLVPAFDAYVVGGYPRDRLISPEGRSRSFTSANGSGRRRGGRDALAGSLPVLLVDGTVAGTWQRVGSGRKTSLSVEPFGALDDDRLRELEQQAARIRDALGVEATLAVGPVEARPHL